MSKTEKADARKSNIEVRMVRSARDKRLFIDLPYRLHRDDPHWIAPLRLAQKDILNTERHPFYKTSDVQMFLACREGRVTGRIMAILNRAYNEFHNERASFFGFFECENDFDAASELFYAASDWLRSRGAEVIRGPVHPSTNYECGLLVDNYDRDPMVMMPYNPPYYAELLERCGMKKAMDLFTYDLLTENFVDSEKLQRVVDRLKTRHHITIRSVDLKDFKREVERIRQVYNDAWSKNWGFVPVTELEFDHLAKDMKQIVDPAVVLIAEKQVEGSAEPVPIGFFLAVPDLNQALKKVKNGRLLPFGLLRLLWHSRKLKMLRVITMGVAHEYQSFGAGAIFLNEIHHRAISNGYLGSEMGWMLETNVLMLRSIELIGGTRGKTYRIYEMPLI